jgi:hypothetical protein
MKHQAFFYGPVPVFQIGITDDALVGYVQSCRVVLRKFRIIGAYKCVHMMEA